MLGRNHQNEKGERSVTSLCLFRWKRMESGEGMSLRTKENPACETDKKETQMCRRQTRH